jgi:hypothetical protein
MIGIGIWYCVKQSRPTSRTSLEDKTEKINLVQSQKYIRKTNPH